MSWLLAFIGFAALIILHEFGHFVVAKAVGMRVERFSLFFPPLIWRRQGKGETEYAIGAIPLGGYVKISGMNPQEVLPPGQEHRAYYRQPVWKRIAVIAAGPAVNIVIAFVIITALIASNGVVSTRVESIEPGTPAASVLRIGDRVVSVDGVKGVSDQVAKHRCAAKRLTPGCKAATPAKLVIERDGQTFHASVKPVFDGRLKSMRLGYTRARETVGVTHAAGDAAHEMWRVTSASVSTIAQLFDPAKRKEISGVVGSYEVTRQAVKVDATTALYILAIISLSLGVINLFPFLPLDGGHIFWALAEKVRGRAVPFSVMERAGFVGFALVMFLFVIGLTNDIPRVLDGGFNLSR